MLWISDKYRSAVGGPVEVTACRLQAAVTNQPSYRPPPSDLPDGFRESGTIRRFGEVLARIFTSFEDKELIGIEADDALIGQAILASEARLVSQRFKTIVGRVVQADGCIILGIRRRNTDMPLVKVVIPKGGPAKIEVEEVTGPGCKTLTDGLVQRLGGDAEYDEKPEFYEQVVNEDQTIQQPV
jgi:hypothetical protein